MRARHLVFHIRCFSCAVCNAPLTKGDQFGMRESTVFCRWVPYIYNSIVLWIVGIYEILFLSFSVSRLHYEISLEPASTASTPMSMSCQYSQFGTSPNDPPSPNGATESAIKVGPPCGGGGQLVVGLSGSSGGGGFFASTPPHHGLTGLPQAPRQKGRPRKRKPKDIEAMASNLGECSLILLYIYLFIQCYQRHFRLSFWQLKSPILIHHSPVRSKSPLNVNKHNFIRL